MATPLRSPNPFGLEQARLKSLIEEVSQRLQRRDVETEEELLMELFQAYRRLYLALREPEFEARELDPLDLRTPETLNRPLREIEHDLKTLGEVAPLLSKTLAQGFNYVQALEEMARERLKLGSNRSIDLRIVSGSLRKDLIVAGDDFQDLSRLDLEKVSPERLAEPSPFGGAVTLRRLGARDLAEDGPIEVKVSGPPGLYEGRLYAQNPGQVDPEGGALKFTQISGAWQNQAREGVSPEIRSRYEMLNAWLKKGPQNQQQLGVQGEVTAEQGLQLAQSQGQFGGLTRDEWEQIAQNVHYERTFTRPTRGTPFDTRQDRPEDPDVKVDLLPATEEEKQEKRQKMLDRAADTYWQCELVYETTEEFNRVKLFEDGQTVGAVPERDYEELKAQVQSRFDPRDLEVTLTLDLKEPRTLNLLTIHPYIPDPVCVPEVVSIRVSENGSRFEEIEELKSGRFETHLAEDVNKELSRDEIVFSLAANKYQYHGQGVFAFAPRTARFVEIRLRERTPIPAPYAITRFLLERTVSTQVKKERSFRSTSRRTTVDRYSRHHDLPYLESLLLMRGEAESDQLVPVTEGGGRHRRRDGMLDPLLSMASFAAAGANPILGVAAIVANAVAALSTKTRVRTSDTGWQIAEMTPVVRYDRARYALGVRELGLFRYEYALESEFVSIPFRTPKPISNVALEADYSIPSSVAPEDAAKLLDFSFSLDDGKTWNPIAPKNGSVPRTAGGAFIPQVYHVNSGLNPERRDRNAGYVDLAGEKPHAVRLRALIKGIAGSSDLTPVLKGYRLLLGVEGDL